MLINVGCRKCGHYEMVNVTDRNAFPDKCEVCGTEHIYDESIFDEADKWEEQSIFMMSLFLMKLTSGRNND